MTEKPPNLISGELLKLYPTRETKIARIREVEKRLEKMELSDEENDPVLIEGHIRLTRAYRSGCGVFLLCMAALGARMALEGSTLGRFLSIAGGLGGAFMILRGLLYRPDPRAIQEAYRPYRGTPEYRELVDELDMLARALSHDLRVEDDG